MKTLKRFTAFAYTLSLIAALMLSGSGCMDNSNPLAGASDGQGLTLGKGAKRAKNVKAGKTTGVVLTAAIIKVVTVSPDSAAKLNIVDPNINGGRFNIAAGNVASPITMRLTKLNAISNVYRLEPFGMNLPNGVAIRLDFDHSAMPFGVSAANLRVFQLISGEYVALESKVNTRKMRVRATAYSSGEFALGAYDAFGALRIIEGEYGVRKDAWIKPRKGGTIHLGGGSSLTIPRGALNQRTLIGIIATRATLRGRGDAKTFTFTPHGTVFNAPITLVLNWSELEGQPVDLMYFNERTQNWQVSARGVWDEENETVTLKISHFSRYAFAWSR